MVQVVFPSPSPTAFGKQLRMCSTLLLFEHNWHAEVFAMPWLYRLVGLGEHYRLIG